MRRVYGLDADGAVGQVEAAEVVPVLEEARDDLPKPQRHYGQIVPAQPEGRRADDHPAHAGEGRGHEQQYPERDVYPRNLLAGKARRGRAELEAHLLKLAGGEPSHGVGAKGVERDEAKVQEPRESDDDVEPQRQQDVDGDYDDGEDEVELERTVHHREDERGHDEQRR